jgi:formylglycine-generating enzyme required for sulfatase activity
MTQYNAIQFCKWLYLQTGIFFRLPTEAEWEYACRAGSASAYYFGDDVSKLKDYGWYAENSNGKTMPVGTKQPNGWGLYDMHGNVAEWTIDQYVPDAYSTRKSPAVDPIVSADQLYPHTLKGGSFADEAGDCRSASRKPSDPMWKRLDPQIPKSNWWLPEAPFVGLRIVRPLKIPSQKEIAEYYNKAPIKDF